MRGFRDHAGAALATSLGTGFFPVAPGTVGSILAAVVFWFVGHGRPFLLVPIIALAWVGCHSGRRLWGKDPSRVNIDEFAGCWVACLASPAEWGLYGIAAALALFRVMDIAKPWPVSLLDRIDTSFGILADDIAAGLIAGAILLGAGALLPW